MDGLGERDGTLADVEALSSLREGRAGGSIAQVGLS